MQCFIHTFISFVPLFASKSFHSQPKKTRRNGYHRTASNRERCESIYQYIVLNFCNGECHGIQLSRCSIGNRLSRHKMRTITQNSAVEERRTPVTTECVGFSTFNFVSSIIVVTKSYEIYRTLGNGLDIEFRPR